MALDPKSSFSAGELDPALHERTNLQKYRSALATARNVIIGKTGRLLSRPGRKFLVETKLDDRRVKLHALNPGLNGFRAFLEWGHQYVRVYDFEGTLYGELSHAYLEDDLDGISFLNFHDGWDIADGVLIFVKGDPPLLLQLAPLQFVTGFFGTNAAPSNSSAVTDTGTGTSCDFLFTAVLRGEESIPRVHPTAHQTSISTANALIFDITYTDAAGVVVGDINCPEEVRVYRRPAAGGAYGYVGSSTEVRQSGPNNVIFTWNDKSTSDFAKDADYAHSPPSLALLTPGTLIESEDDLESRAGIVYQQRLILSHEDKLFASRTGFPYNFYRDYPISDSSALALRTSVDNAWIIRIIEHDGLIVFTTKGVYVSRGVLSPDNLGFDKKGDWVIDHNIPPISLPAGLLFVDSLTNTVRLLQWSEELNVYIAEELSIFSDHLLTGRRVKSWAFQGGNFPILWVIFNDGEYAAFTYDREHEMKAWTRCDSGTNIEEVAVASIFVNNSRDPIDSKNINRAIFVTLNGTTRSIEIDIPRYPTVEQVEDNLEYDKQEHIAAMDAVVSFKNLIQDHQDDLVAPHLQDDIVLSPTDLANPDWSGELYLQVVDDAILTNTTFGEVGAILRWFHPVTRHAIDLEVVARDSNNKITVQPSEEFPEEYATNPRLYLTETTFTGLDHLEGEDVAIISDGYVVASPNNDFDSYPTVTVESGSVTLPNDLRGAIVHIGRPYVMDVETLDIDSVEQRPVLIESKTVNKVYVKVHKTRGLFVGSRFPSTGVAGEETKGNQMVPLSTQEVDYEDDNPIIGNRYDQPTSKRYEVTIPGDWKSNGRVCLRQVDPLHFEILSIIPDLEDLRR